MSGRIYLIGADGALTAMDQQPYDAESLLQRLLAEHPDLLAGEQIRPGNPRRWLLVNREVAVPDREGGGGRWSMDHWFLDQDGVPTLVEVKRSSDTRTRREVVGQMLDYAANAVLLAGGSDRSNLFGPFSPTAPIPAADRSSSVAGCHVERGPTG